MSTCEDSAAAAALAFRHICNGKYFVQFLMFVFIFLLVLLVVILPFIQKKIDTPPFLLKNWLFFYDHSILFIFKRSLIFDNWWKFTTSWLGFVNDIINICETSWWIMIHLLFQIHIQFICGSYFIKTTWKRAKNISILGKKAQQHHPSTFWSELPPIYFFLFCSDSSKISMGACQMF